MAENTRIYLRKLHYSRPACKVGAKAAANVRFPDQQKYGCDIIHHYLTQFRIIVALQMQNVYLCCNAAKGRIDERHGAYGSGRSVGN
ncbi:hypothetical protein PAF17_04450 [Paracoccus sp. Z330]|uniref:Uncharacterized protein n=1 Tax=Paracoccus onchidii TaxID=3017813 RepID=A0ABT4ZBL5_9RHOB|nr:hypothetical protein [Paracoccus onchidii]MDB6176754.1 hypothetical protein [Paracoccus onchidii]